METLAKVEGHTGIYRDEVTGAIVNTDMKSFQYAKNRKQNFLNQKNEINTLKNEVSDMKQMLHTIIEKLNG